MMENLDPLARRHVIAALAVSQPASVFRLAATSRGLKNNTQDKRSQLTALKRLLHRKAAFRRHSNELGRLENNLFNAKRTAYRIGQMSPARQRAYTQKRLRNAAAVAYYQYQTTGNWNRFVRIHAKRGLGGNISRVEARRLYF